MFGNTCACSCIIRILSYIVYILYRVWIIAFLSGSIIKSRLIFTTFFIQPCTRIPVYAMFKKYALVNIKWTTSKIASIYYWNIKKSSSLGTEVRSSIIIWLSKCNLKSHWPRKRPERENKSFFHHDISWYSTEYEFELEI